MDQARIDIFLDQGWCVVDQLYRWSSNTLVESDDRAVLISLIRDLQKLWSMADDLQLNRLARAILAIEQTLERICARSFVFSDERVQDVASGIEGLQEQLLGFEATREEPDFTSFETLLRIEQYVRLMTTSDNDQPVVTIDPDTTVISLNPLTGDSNSDSAIVPTTSSLFDAWTSPPPIDTSRVLLLEQFTADLEDACRHLLVRIQADEAPYATTASRLEHLAKETRILAEQIVDEIRLMGSARVGSEHRTADPMTESVALPVRSISIASEPPPLTRLPAVSEHSLPLLESAARETAHDAIRILIVEESLFFRHLLGVAVRSAGYQPELAESAVQGLDMLHQATEIRAIVVGSRVSPALVDAIEQRRQSMQFKVIGMTLPGRDKVPISDLDARISKMHPQLLIAELDRLLIGSADQSRKSA